MKKNFVLVILLITLLLIVGAFLVWQKTAKAPTDVTPPVAPPVVITPPPVSQVPADWKEYSNTKYHYSFRYPKEYYIYQLAGIGVPREVTEDANLISIRKSKDQEDIFSIWGRIINIKDEDSFKERFGIADSRNAHIIKSILSGQPVYGFELKAPDRRVFIIYLIGRSIALQISTPTGNFFANQIFSSITFTK